MLRLAAPTAKAEPAEELMASECCYETVIAAGRENTYFVRHDDADALRDAAYALAGVPASRPPCQPLTVCYFQRSEGKPGGRWEGGARVIVNKQQLLQLMTKALQETAPGDVVRVVNINSTHTFERQSPSSPRAT